MRVDLRCNRSTLQLALAALRAEGLVYSVPGIGWYPNRIEEHATLELIRERFEIKGLSEWPALMRELLDYRRMLYIAVVDAMVRRGLKVSPSADFFAWSLRHLRENAQHAHDVLEQEEAFFVALAESLDNLALKLSIQTVRRIFDRYRFQFGLPFLLAPLSAQLDALIEALDAGILPLALIRAHEIATSRDELHLALARPADVSEAERSA